MVTILPLDHHTNNSLYDPGQGVYWGLNTAFLPQYLYPYEVIMHSCHILTRDEFCN